MSDNRTFLTDVLTRYRAPAIIMASIIGLNEVFSWILIAFDLDGLRGLEMVGVWKEEASANSDSQWECKAILQSMSETLTCKNTDSI